MEIRKELCKKAVDHELCGYVDDLAMVVDQKDIVKTYNVLTTTFAKYGFKMNFASDGSKTALMPLTIEKGIPIVLKALITSTMKAGKIDIPLTDTYKYLGIHINSQLSGEPAIQNTLNTFYTRYSLFSPALRRATMRFRINSYVTFILPTLMLVPVFLNHLKDYAKSAKFAHLFNITAKTWLGLPNSFPNEGLYDIIGTDPDRLSGFAQNLAAGNNPGVDKPKE